MTQPSYDWMRQESYYSQGLSSIPRRDLLSSRNLMRVFIVRNHPVEFPIRILRRLAAYMGVDLEVTISDYDDSLGALSTKDVDSVLIWPDWSRIDGPGLDIALDRIEQHRSSRTSVLLAAPKEVVLRDRIVDWAKSTRVQLLELPDFENAGSSAVRRFSGSELSTSSQLSIARTLLLRWLAPLILPVLKLLVVDLDNTLYSGVLVEDGVKSLRVTDKHLRLNQTIERLAREGVLVAVVSRNSQSDVDQLLLNWPEGLFPVNLAVEAVGTTESKGAVVKDLVERLQTVPESVMFLDDNPGEVLEVETLNPGIWPVLASDSSTANTILEAQLSRLMTNGRSMSETRLADTKAKKKRETVLVSARSVTNLHEELCTRLSTWSAKADELERASDLLSRTNQFNTSIRRTGLDRLREISRSPDGFVVLAKVQDTFADSGIVAVMVGHAEETEIVVEEFAISCRVLGRSLEPVIAHNMLLIARSEMASVQFYYRTGPRNLLALDWLVNYAGHPLDQQGEVTLDLNRLDLDSRELDFVAERNRY
jgi:FkbH-like protein